MGSSNMEVTGDPDRKSFKRVGLENPERGGFQET